jgi:hypothetical protein
MSVDGEMESWRRQWQRGAGRSVDADTIERLRRSVVRETFWSKWGLVFPILVTLLSGATVVMPALRSGRPLGMLLGGETLVFAVVVWGVALWLGRGTWRPFGDTTAAFIDVSIRRRVAYIRGAIAGACLYLAQFAFLVVVLSLESPMGIVGALSSAPAKSIGWIGMPVVFAGLYWFARRQQGDLERLRELKRQLQSD